MKRLINFAAYDIEGEKLSFDHRIECREENNAFYLTLSVCNTATAPAYPALFRIAEWDSGKSALHVFKPGFHKPSDNAWFYTAEVGKPLSECNTYISDWLKAFPKTSLLFSTMSAMQLSKNEWMAWGFTTFEAYHGVIEYDVKGKSTIARAWLEGEQAQFDVGVWTPLEEIVILKGSFIECTEGYAERVIALHGKRSPAAMTGWSDWEYYRLCGKSENAVLESLKTIQQMKLDGWPIDSAVIDAGWCKNTYSWDVPNEKFPHGAKWLCQQIEESDVRSGIWIAPWLTTNNSPIAREHPEWLLRCRSTNEIRCAFRSDGEYLHTIDYSIPEAVEWFRSQLRMLLSWGYRYLKLDGPVFRHYDDTCFHDPHSTRYRQINVIMRLLREECGENVLIESEGVYGPAVGIADFHRVTQDEHPQWYTSSNDPKLAENTPTTLCSAMWNGRFWSNLNLFVLRDAPTPYMESNEGNQVSNVHEHLLTATELESNLTSIWFTCSSIFYSAPFELTLRSERQTDLMRRVVPSCTDVITHPVDVENDFPMIYRSQVGKRSFLHVYNHGEKYLDTVTLPLGGRYHVYDYWNERYLGILEGEFSLTNLAPRGCRLYWLTPVEEEICLVGANAHIAGLGIFAKLDDDAQTIEIGGPSFLQAEQSVTLTLSENIRVTSKNEGVLIDQRQAGVLRVLFTQKNESIILTLEKER